MQSKIKWIFSFLIVAMLSFVFASCMPRVESERGSEVISQESTEKESAVESGFESQTESPYTSETESQIIGESGVLESASDFFESDSNLQSDWVGGQESQTESESESVNQSETAVESSSTSEIESEIESESQTESESASEIESSSESAPNSEQFVITVSGWTVELGDFSKTATYDEPIAVHQIIKNAGVTVSASKLRLTMQEGGKIFKFNPNEIVDYSCEILVEDTRTFVTVKAPDGSGAQREVRLLLGLKTYRAGNAIADAGFSFEKFYWELTRSNNGEKVTTPLTSDQTVLRDRDILTGRVLGAVRVIFDCSNYGVLNIGNGGYELDYSKGSTWNNPQILLAKSVDKALTFKGWTFTKYAIGSGVTAQKITTVDQIFAQKLEEVTVYPVFSVNYANLQGWFKIEEQNAYAQIIGEEVFFHGDGIETSGALKLSCKGGEVYFKLDASLTSDEKSEFRLNFDQRPTGAIIKIRVDDPSGSTIYLCEGREQFDAFLSRADLVLRSLSCDGYDATPEQIENGKYYVAYFSYYTYP